MNAIATKPELTGQNSKQLADLEMRDRVVALARQGHSVRAICGIVGYSSTQSVQRHIDAYRASLTPSSELAEEWRASKLARADERFRRLGEKALGVRGEDGEWLVEPDYQALTALQREEEAVAKLLGANLEPRLGVVAVTAEMLAALLFEQEAAIDVQATEITEGGDA